MSVALAWPWLLLLAPAPWLVRRYAPAARRRPGPALRVPFFDDLARGAPEPAGEAIDARRPARALALTVWLLLLLAASRPVSAGGVEFYVWPLGMALLLAMGAAFTTLRRVSRPRPLPGAGGGRAP